MQHKEERNNKLFGPLLSLQEAVLRVCKQCDHGFVDIFGKLYYICGDSEEDGDE